MNKYIPFGIKTTTAKEEKKTFFAFLLFSDWIAYCHWIQCIEQIDKSEKLIAYVKFVCFCKKKLLFFIFRIWWKKNNSILSTKASLRLLFFFHWLKKWVNERKSKAMSKKIKFNRLCGLLPQAYREISRQCKLWFSLRFFLCCCQVPLLKYVCRSKKLHTAKKKTRHRWWTQFFH